MRGQSCHVYQCQALCIRERGLTACRKGVLFRHQILCKAGVYSRAEHLQAKAESNGHYGPVASQSPKSTSHEDRLWDRQDAMWEREMKRWDAERALWTAKEERLQQKIAELHALVIRLTTGGRAGIPTITDSSPLSYSSAQAPPAASAAAPQYASIVASAPQAAQQMASQAPEPGTAPPAASAQETIDAPEDGAAVLQHAGSPAAAAAFAEEPEAPPSANSPLDESVYDLAGFQALYDRKAEEAGGSSNFAADLANAIAAVDLTDVMEEDRPFRKVEEQGRRQGSSSASAPSVAGEVAAAAAPILVPGSDDIFWVNQLHSALSGKGFFPGDEEMEAWLFGDQTASALLTFQAVAGVPETGVCDSATWAALLGEEALLQCIEEAARLGMLSGEETSGATPAAHMSRDGSAAPAGQPEQPRQSEPSPDEQLDDWPILREGEGGKLVHHLQVLLNQHGYYCGEEETVWWQFGMDTYSSLLTFQACNTLPETGVTDVRTWTKLMRPGAEPSDILALYSNDETDDDMQACEGKVWLLGEQRWAKIG